MNNIDESYSSKTSLYCYKDTNILINKLDIKSEKKLHTLERKIVLLKSYELRQKNVTGDFSINHFKNIHKFLFENIYDFAGEFRKEDIAKDSFRFASFLYIEDELNRILNKLKLENYLIGISKENLSKELAYYLAEINVLHPFREGNGRVTREFIRQIAYNAGYKFDLRSIEPKAILDACIKSVYDTIDLENIIKECLFKI